MNVPFLGTLFGALRYGSVVGRLNNGRSDVIDDDIDFMIGASSNHEWTHIVELIGNALDSSGFHGCYTATGADQLDYKLFPSIRSDMLSCGYYEPYFIQLDLRSYVRIGIGSGAVGYQHRLMGPGYEFCDREEGMISSSILAPDPPVGTALTLEDDMLAGDAFRRKDGRGNPLPRSLHVSGGRRKRHGGTESFFPEKDSSTFAKQRNGALPSDLTRSYKLNPLCFLPTSADFQVWKGQIPLSLILPLSKCQLYNTTLPCPRQPLEVLKYWNGGEYQIPGHCMAVPHFAGRKLQHAAADPRNREFSSGVTRRDLDLLVHYATELSENGFESFLPLYKKLGDDFTCNEVKFAELVGEAGNTLCPPAKEVKGFSEYERYL